MNYLLGRISVSNEHCQMTCVAKIDCTWELEGAARDNIDTWQKNNQKEIPVYAHQIPCKS